jgi:hypothetical protein
MGSRTEFIGHFEIDPPLDDAESSYLIAFAESRRCTRKQGPYWVPDNPVAARVDRDDTDVRDPNTPPKGQPGLWCPWLPGSARHLSIPRHDGKHYASGAWLQYLLTHFLRPGGLAARAGTDLFDEFTFDHTVAGVVGACRDDTGELWLIRPAGDIVVEETVWPGRLEEW